MSEPDIVLHFQRDGSVSRGLSLGSTFLQFHPLLPVCPFSGTFLGTGLILLRRKAILKLASEQAYPESPVAVRR
jgi:hypothetical protein